MDDFDDEDIPLMPANKTLKGRMVLDREDGTNELDELRQLLYEAETLIDDHLPGYTVWLEKVGILLRGKKPE